MKNKITDLRDHMFAQLERLNDESLTPEQLKLEIERAMAIADIGKVVVESAKTEVLALKLTGKLTREDPPKFLNDRDEAESGKKNIARPPAVYNNIKAIK